MASTEEIRKNILELLRSDTRVDSRNIVVEVSQDTVRLSGTTSTLISLRAAEFIATRVEGVKRVDNRIKIWSPGDERLPDDQTVSNDVKKAISLDKSIDSEMVRIDVEDGVVTLSGSVDSYWKKHHCEEIISEVNDVAMVINKLTITPAHKAEDAEIAENVRLALERMGAGLNTEYVTITVENGIVTLTGKVPHWNAYNAAEYATRHTRGVRDFKNEILIT
jgi:osmotically-inducible protein OsmY